MLPFVASRITAGNAPHHRKPESIKSKAINSQYNEFCEGIYRFIYWRAALLAVYIIYRLNTVEFISTFFDSMIISSMIRAKKSNLIKVKFTNWWHIQYWTTVNNLFIYLSCTVLRLDKLKLVQADTKVQTGLMPWSGRVNNKSYTLESIASESVTDPTTGYAGVLPFTIMLWCYTWEKSGKMARNVL